MWKVHLSHLSYNFQHMDHGTLACEKIIASPKSQTQFIRKVFSAEVSFMFSPIKLERSSPPIKEFLEVFWDKVYVTTKTRRISNLWFLMTHTNGCTQFASTFQLADDLFVFKFKWILFFLFFLLSVRWSSFKLLHTLPNQIRIQNEFTWNKRDERHRKFRFFLVGGTKKLKSNKFTVS